MKRRPSAEAVWVVGESGEFYIEPVPEPVAQPVAEPAQELEKEPVGADATGGRTPKTAGQQP